jgi:hypothetical protein
MRLVFDILGFAFVVFLLIGFVRGLTGNNRSGRTDDGPAAWVGDNGSGHSGDGGSDGPGT